MQRIIDIIPYSVLPYHNGGQKSIALFCKYLGSENTLLAITTKNTDSDLAENYEVKRVFGLSKLRYINPAYFFAVKKLIKKFGAAHVITEHPYMAWMGWLLKKATGIRWSVRSHNIEYERFKSMGKWWWPLLKVYEQWAYKNADQVIFVTDEDRLFAGRQMKLRAEKSITVPFGIEQKDIPDNKERLQKITREKYQLPQDAFVFLFNGALGYEPNYEALEFIVDQLNPLLLSKALFDYRILICGKGLPERFNDLKEYSSKKIVYAGFVDDIEPYFISADIFLNPVVKGGGIKTKLVEAIGYNNTVVSCVSGATGIDKKVCGEKLFIVPDNDALAFEEAIYKAVQKKANTPSAYYDAYYWGSIVKKVK